MATSLINAISVIVSSFNGAQYLPRLIETLKAQQGVQLEIIIIDRNSTDGSDAIYTTHPDIKVIKHPPETGLVCGYAVGADVATHDLLFFCNEDMWYEPDCLRQLCERVNLEPRIGALMPVQWTYDGSDIVNAGAWFEKSWWCPANPYPFRRSNWRLTEHSTVVSGINAGACLIHRKAYEAIGGWDRTFFLDYEDMDLSIRLWQHDWKCLVVPEAKVYHAVGASNNQNINNGRIKVSRKRYIEGGSNIFAITIKTFSGAAIFTPVLAITERCLRNLTRFRFNYAWWDVLVVATVLKRLGNLLEFRRMNNAYNKVKPGQQFFTDAAFAFERAGLSQPTAHS